MISSRPIVISIAILLGCLLLFSGCSTQTAPTQPQSTALSAMELQPAVLNQDERRLLSLTGSSDLIFDYLTDESLRSASVFCYQLDESNQWQPASGGGRYNLSSANGRLALQADNIANGVRVSFQSANGAVSASRKSLAQQTPLPEGMTLQNILLDEPQTIDYDKEIPLLLQCQMPQNEYIAYQVSDFFHPERFTQQGIHTVYAITVRFSRNQLGNDLLEEATQASDEQAAEQTAEEEEVAEDLVEEVDSLN